MHPLTKDLTKLNDKELSDKIADLQKRLALSYRMGNPYLAEQVRMMLNDYQAEHQRRADIELQKLMEKSGKNFKDIINIE